LAAPLVTYQGVREFQNLWLSRLDVCGQVSWPSEDKTNCKDVEARSGWWLKGFGYFGEQDARAASTGYNSQIIGSMIAYDEPIALNTRAGVGIGYARSAIKGKTYDARTDFDSYQATAYIGHDQGPFFVQGSASFGWNEYSEKRHIQYTGMDSRANARYSGQDYTAFARTGYHISAPMKFIVTPTASLQYSRVNIDSYTEDGAGDANLKVNAQHYNFLESGLGAKLERAFNIRNWAIVPELRFEWLHMISNPKLAQTGAFNTPGSTEFTTYGLKTVADMYHAGTGLTLLSCNCSATRWSLEGGYDYYWRVDGYSANQVTARVTARF
jgi:outer membrane autotransporter protein